MAADISIDEPQKTNERTNLLMDWLRKQTEINNGKLPKFSNALAAEVMGIPDRKKYGRHQGSIHSRIDFACYLCNLPPLGLGADEPFDGAWKSEEGGREQRIDAMARTVKEKTWSNDEFTALQTVLDKLPPGATKLWNDEIADSQDKVRAWTNSLAEGNSPAVGINKNPNWTRDELILALHLYMQNHKSIPSKTSKEVNTLSRLLNRLAEATAKTKTYRNAAGVYMKLMNFRSIDPRYTEQGKIGLKRGNKDEKVVWSLFADDLPHLKKTAEFITTNLLCSPAHTGITDDDEDDIADCEEGRIYTRLHRFRERNRKLADSFKKKARKENAGQLVCAGCDLDFVIKYGEMADRLVDVHHTKPVHTLLPGQKTSAKDLVLLCVSCHRAVHSRKKWLSIPELRTALDENQANRLG